MPCSPPSFRSLSKTKTTAEHGMSHQTRWSGTHNNVTRAFVTAASVGADRGAKILVFGGPAAPLATPFPGAGLLRRRVQHHQVLAVGVLDDADAGPVGFVHHHALD